MGMRILHVVGARPNFMKVAPIIEAIQAHNNGASEVARIKQLLVHTGQHYDRAMSELFFDELGMPQPDINLNIGSGPHGQQTGRIMEAFEAVLLEHQPDLVLVVGDVNSTMACAIDAKKLGIPVAHVEAGLRSGDMDMPEEINRVVTDSITDLFFTTDRIASELLRRVGAPDGSVHFVGNVMIDSLLKHRERALRRETLGQLGLVRGGGPRQYAVVTLHRPSNVDDPKVLRNIGSALAELGRHMPIIFPCHPRSRKQFAEHGIEALFSAENGVHLLEPLGYLDFLNLMACATVVLTDSGGIQEESTILGVPCLTLRNNTERPITIEQGTNRLVGNRREDIVAAIDDVLTNASRTHSVPELWDGQSARRILAVLLDWWEKGGASRN